MIEKSISVLVDNTVKYITVMKSPDKLETSAILKAAIMQLAEAGVGIACFDRKDRVRMLSALVQRTTNHGFLYGLKKLWDDLKKEGKIAEDYEMSTQRSDCLRELLDFLDRDLPDETRFCVLKKIMLVAATETIDDRSSPIPQQLMQLARTLKSGEILVLGAVDQIANEREKNIKVHNFHLSEWRLQVAERSGLEIPGLVKIHEEACIDKGLISETMGRSTFSSEERIGKNFRLTTLGSRLCVYLETYDQQMCSSEEKS